MQKPGILKLNPFRDFSADDAAGHALAGEFECSRCHESVPAAKRGAAPQMLAIPASLFADVARSAGNFCNDCARNVNMLGAFGLMLVIGELAIVLADMKKYF
jgi:hypothetical protein